MVKKDFLLVNTNLELISLAQAIGIKTLAELREFIIVNGVTQISKLFNLLKERFEKQR